LRNKIDLSTNPDALFLNPWGEEGVKLLSPPDFIWREREGGIIEGFAVSAYPEINAKVRSLVRGVQRNKRFLKSIEVNSVPAVIEHASFRKSHALAGEKLVLSGASAVRLYNEFRAEWSDDQTDANETLNAYFTTCREANAERQFPIEKMFLEPDLDFAIACRNTFNYYHFIMESLSQLCVLDRVGFQGNIYFHYPNQDDKKRRFTDDFVQALFPEYAGRVFFERSPKAYDLVLCAYEFIGGMGQVPQIQLDGISKLAPQGSAVGTIEFQPVLAMNAVSTSLLALRDRGLKAIEGHDFSHLPKRFFVGRSEDQSRQRPLAGQELLLEHLLGFGFQYVVFEDYTPLEQIALMAQAEMIISHHGAGFANMLFAAPETYVIELGTLQTAQSRWADFWPLAHASGCRYLNFFSDFNAEDQLAEPKFSIDGIVPTFVGEKAAAQIISFVVTILGRMPSTPDVETLSQLGSRVLRAGAVEQAITLLAHHADMVHGDAALCLLLADCHKALDEPKSELLALEAAIKADPSRWQTLIRIIWCANRVERPEFIRWALARLAEDFPERHDAFVANHNWVKFVG
jgi:capsular polysaccharide biosynthesis protein